MLPACPAEGGSTTLSRDFFRASMLTYECSISLLHPSRLRLALAIVTSCSRPRRLGMPYGRHPLVLQRACSPTPSSYCCAKHRS